MLLQIHERRFCVSDVERAPFRSFSVFGKKFQTGTDEDIKKASRVRAPEPIPWLGLKDNEAVSREAVCWVAGSGNFTTCRAVGAEHNVRKRVMTD